MSIVKQLYSLQEIEKEISQLEKRADEIKYRLSENEAVVKAEEALREKRERLEETRREQQHNEWEVEDIGHRVEAAQKKLYNGSTGNPKELLSRQQDIEALKIKQEGLETRSIELMDEFEAAKNKVAEAEDELARLRADKQRMSEELSKELENVNTRVSDLKGERERLIASVPPDAAQQYYRIKSMKDVAVARIERGICCGCRISLPAREIQQARGSRLVSCSSCGRLLFMP